MAGAMSVLTAIPFYIGAAIILVGIVVWFAVMIAGAPLDTDLWPDDDDTYANADAATSRGGARAAAPPRPPSGAASSAGSTARPDRPLTRGRVATACGRRHPGRF
jgi:hypothetical protein